MPVIHAQHVELIMDSGTYLQLENSQDSQCLWVLGKYAMTNNPYLQIYGATEHL